MKLTYKVKEDKIEFYVDNSYLTTCESKDRYIIYDVIRALRIQYGLGLAEAKEVWDSQQDKSFTRLRIN